MLVEREPQLALLREAAAASQGRLALVTGEAGSGKTSLVKELIARPGSRRIVLGACDHLRTPRPFAPALDWAHQIDPGLATMFRDGTPRSAVFDRVLAALSSTRSLVVLEDAHWADDATVDLLQFLYRRAPAAGALLIVTYRPDAVGAGTALALTLGDLASSNPLRVAVPPLTRDGVAILATGSGTDVDRLLDRTGGNAFFVTVCLSTGEAVPAAVRDAVLARVDHLSPLAAEAARVASIFPGRVGFSTVMATGASERGLDDAIAVGFLVAEATGVRFRHELARVAVEDSLAPSRRRALHRLALEVLSERSDTDPAQLSHHAVGSGDPAAIVRHALAAARAARAAGANQEAVAQFELMLAQQLQLPVAIRFDVLRQLAELYDVLGRYSLAIGAGEEALALSSATPERAALLLQLGSTLTSAGRLPDAETRLSEAIDLLTPGGPSAQLAQAYSQRCSHAMLARKPREAESWAQRALPLAAEYGDEQTLITTMIQSGTALFMSGDAEGLPRVQAGIARAREQQRHNLVALGLTQIGSGGGEIRHYALAVPALRDCVAYAGEHEVAGRGLYSTAWLGRCLVEQGGWDEATEVLAGLLRSPRTEGITLTTAQTALGRLRARRGDPGAWELLDAALAFATRTGHLQRLWPVTAARAEAAWLEGRLHDELPLLQEVFASSLSLEQPWATGELACWLQRAGVPVAACAAAPPYALELAADFTAAAASWAEIGCPYEQADALARGSDDEQLRALRSWGRLGARPAIRRLNERRRAAGLPVPRGPNAATSGNAAGLTNRELDVLRLLARGLRDAEIAEHLVLSPKTVGHHVSHILAKLDVRSRSEAAVRAPDVLGNRRPP